MGLHHSTVPLLCMQLVLCVLMAPYRSAVRGQSTLHYPQPAGAGISKRTEELELQHMQLQRLQPSQPHFDAQPLHGTGRQLTSDQRPAAVAPACPLPSKELVAKHAKDNTLIMASMNMAMANFALNWYAHLERINVTNVLVSVYEDESAALLADRGIPCQDVRQLIDIDPKAGFEWGGANWSKASWARTVILAAALRAGCNVVWSDIDVVWLRDPTPLFREAAYADADLMLSTDAVTTYQADGGFEDPRPVWLDHFNAGVNLWRAKPEVVALAAAWEALRGQTQLWDQDALNLLLLRNGTADDEMGRQDLQDPGFFHPANPRVFYAFNRTVATAVFPLAKFSSGHAYTLQRLHEKKGIEPYVMHATWIYGDQAGKLARLREHNLWLLDDETYFTGPNFLAFDLLLPTAPEFWSMWEESQEAMLTYHLKAVEMQLHQLYHGLALAVALNRTIILPQMRCFCDKFYAPTVRCRTPRARDLPLPFPCPLDYLLLPAAFEDQPQDEGLPAIPFRVPSFLSSPALPQWVKDSRLTVQPSAELTCGPDGCPVLRTMSDSNPGQVKGITIPARLPDTSLQQVLEPYNAVKLVHFRDVTAAWGGFREQALAGAFHRRLQRMAGTWCCRDEIDAQVLGKPVLEQYSIAPHPNGTVDPHSLCFIKH